LVLKWFWGCVDEARRHTNESWQVVPYHRHARVQTAEGSPQWRIHFDREDSENDRALDYDVTALWHSGTTGSGARIGVYTSMTQAHIDSLLMRAAW
jgi:hypothetical protein